jgi:hypothetical protein
MYLESMSAMFESHLILRLMSRTTAYIECCNRSQIGQYCRAECYGVQLIKPRTFAADL